MDFYTVCAVCTSLLIFFLDINCPLGVACAMPYVVCLLVVLPSQLRYVVRSLLAYCIILTIAGFLLSPPPYEHAMWMAVTNRALGSFVLVLTAGVVSHAQRTRRDLVSTLDQLDNQMHLASVFQQKLLPAKDTQIPGLDMHGIVHPAERLCGDYYDIIDDSPVGTALIVGDVSGHGAAAAIITTETRTTIRQTLRHNPHIPLEDLMYVVNEAIYKDTECGTFVTLAIVHLSPDNATLSYVGAAHPIFLVRADGTPETFMPQSPPIGVLIDQDIFTTACTTIDFRPNDCLVLCSDGVTESMTESHERFGQKRLLEVIAANREKNSLQIVDAVYEAVQNHIGTGLPLRDDLTLLIVKHTKLGLDVS